MTKAFKKFFHVSIGVLLIVVGLLGFVLPILNGVIPFALGLILISLQSTYLEGKLESLSKKHVRLEKWYLYLREKIKRVFKN